MKRFRDGISYTGSVRRAGAALILLAALPIGAQTIQPPYNSVYSFTDLGAVPGLPTPYGGLTFLTSNSNVIVIGGSANNASGALYSIGVVRGSGNHVTGLTGTVAPYSQGQYNDGGVVFGPGGVLFYTRYPVNEIGEIKPGSTVNDKIVDLDPIGVASSVGALNFVPGGFPGAGQMKIVSYNTSKWYTAAFSSDGLGTYNITSATENTTIQGGPEGFIYVPTGSPLFPNPSILVSEYSAGVVSAYQIDGSGNPIPASRTVFISGLTGAEGAIIDSVTGDFLFSTFGAANHVIVVRGFAIPETPTPTPTGPQPTATPTTTPTATPTATRTPTVPVGAPTVPTLSPPVLVLLGLLLAGVGFWVMTRRS